MAGMDKLHNHSQWSRQQTTWRTGAAAQVPGQAEARHGHGQQFQKQGEEQDNVVAMVMCFRGVAYLKSNQGK